MKKIKIESLNFRNFKSIKDLKIEFNEESNSIYGANGTGKTTIFDGFTWLLFGKNSENSTDFNLKPLDSNNKAIHNLETEIEGVLIIDGEKVVLKRTFREKWTKKKGNEVSELTGHETSFAFNGVPVSLSEYKAKVQGIIDEELFKILINTLFFNTALNWKKRREILSQMVGEISESEILSQMENKEELLQILNSEKNIDEEKKILSAKKKKLKEELETIPSRLDEVQRSIPEKINFEELEAEIELKEKEFSAIDKKILNSSKGNEDEIKVIEEKQKELQKLKNDLFEKKQAFETEKQNKISALKEKKQAEEMILQSQRHEFELLTQKKNQVEAGLKNRKESIEVIRSNWKKANESIFQIEENSLCCPTCKRSLENASDLEAELLSNFNKSKEENLSKYAEEGKNLNADISALEKELKELIEAIEKINSLPCSNIIERINYEILEIENSRLVTSETEKQIQEFKIPELTKQDNSILIHNRFLKRTEIDSLKDKLTDKFLIQKVEARIEELIKQQKSLSQEIANIEKIEIQIETFSRLKIKTIEEKVNSKFALVSFKMFEQQLNGGIDETCICLINGVPFPDLNTASKINAGIDIINALQFHFGFNVPIFIDGRESVTQIIKTESQTVSLIVDDTFKKIRVN